VNSSLCEPRAGYLGFVAHEFRNPLTTALWCAELLERIPAGERGGARGKKLVAMALRSLQRVGALVEDHLLAERLAAGGIPLRPEPVDLRELLAAAGEQAEAGTLALDVAEGTKVEADRGLLLQTVVALLAAVAGDGVAPRAEARPEAGGLRLVVAGASLGADALELPRKGATAGRRARPLSLVMAGAAAAAQGLSLRVEGGALVLGFPAPGK